jgi:hypothetical protein
MLKLSDFYELKTTCSRIIQNAELFISEGASPLMRERRNNRDYDAKVIDSVAVGDPAPLSNWKRLRVASKTQQVNSLKYDS